VNEIEGQFATRRGAKAETAAGAEGDVDGDDVAVADEAA
jgi:hypothetical protein